MNDTTTPALVSVTVWGELRGERKLPGAVLRVLVAGQSAGGVERTGDAWRACWYAGVTRSGSLRDRFTEHATAEDAVRAVIRSAWARHLGARAASAVRWSDRARRAAPGVTAAVGSEATRGCVLLSSVRPAARLATCAAAAATSCGRRGW
jgi:hypothetical protein